jgi:SAM-dependent MidA family methyltransferase
MTKKNITFEQAFIKQLDKRTAMPLDEFVQIALYHPVLGYYSLKEERVGKNNKTDFYTSNSIGAPWGEMIVEASSKILNHANLKEYTFVEIAAEPNCSILDSFDHPFDSTLTLRLNDPFKVPPKSIVFSNEWLDAQPFKRFRFDSKTQKWNEIGVSLIEGEFKESELSTNHPFSFPTDVTDQYTIDWSTGANHCLNELVSKKWKGLFLTFDYGLSKQILFKERPNGTARSYSKHKMNADLFSCLGQKDLTCHLCWDELTNCLTKGGFEKINLQTQESFFMHHSQNSIKKILSGSGDLTNIKLQKLKELIHPQFFGSKFQALWGVRN